MNLDARLIDAAIGESPGTVEKIEITARRAGAAQLFRLARVLGTDVSYFFEESPPPPGRAATPQPVPAADSRLASEAQRFARAFAALTDEDVKQTVRALVDALAESAAGDPPEEEPDGSRPPLDDPTDDPRDDLENGPENDRGP